ncbi:hypothetical protein DOY81_000873, partial [Sarcophaga bullata]
YGNARFKTNCLKNKFPKQTSAGEIQTNFISRWQLLNFIRAKQLKNELKY